VLFVVLLSTLSLLSSSGPDLKMAYIRFGNITHDLNDTVFLIGRRSNLERTCVNPSLLAKPWHCDKSHVVQGIKG
jgi:hypothetical protein